MDFVILVPALIALFVCIVYSPERAFMSVYIPVLLLLPQSFMGRAPLLPALNFAQGTVFVIFVVYFFNHFKEIRLSFIDFAVLSYVAIIMYSEYRNSGTTILLNYFASTCYDVIFPYFLTKWIIVPNNLTIKLSKRIVFLMFVNVLLIVYEERFTQNPYVQYFGYFFKEQEFISIPLYRGGWLRVFGPFMHPILFGLGIALAILLDYWLLKNKLWSRNFKNFIPLVIPKGWIILFVLAAGLLLTFSRGPILNLALGVLFVGAAFSRVRTLSFFLRLGLACLVIMAAQFVYESTISVNRSLADETASSAIYRSELIEQYEAFLEDKPYFGWGKLTIPLVNGKRSIDNQYLYLALMHGKIVVGIYIFIMVALSLRLFWRGLTNPLSQKLDTSFAFTLAGVYLLIGTAAITVFLPMQIGTLLFIFSGWAEAFLHTKSGTILNEVNHA